MIKLTIASGKPIYINPNKIIGVSEINGETHIQFAEDNAFCVTEPAEEVVKKIMTFNLAFEKYKIAYGKLISNDTDVSISFHEYEAELSQKEV